MSIPKANDKQYKAEIASTRNFLRTQYDLKKCRTMMMEQPWIANLPYESKMKFSWSCLYLMEAERLKSAAETTTTTSSTTTNSSSGKDENNNCLSNMNLIIHGNSFNPLLGQEGDDSSNILSKIDNCFQSDSSIVEKARAAEDFLRVVRGTRFRDFMPQFSNRMREWKAANKGAYQDVKNGEELETMLNLSIPDVHKRLTSCLNRFKTTTTTSTAAIPPSTLTNNDESSESLLKLSNEHCLASSQEFFYKTMMISCQRQVADCVEKVNRNLLENEKMGIVIDCVDQVVSDGNKNNNHSSATASTCVSLAMREIEKTIR